MNLRDFITLLGGLCSAVGPVLLVATHDSSLWWTGGVLSAIGPVLTSTRALIKDPEK